ncbi:hypothetical protein GQ53DRAFT_754572 [Thozetella sp. PMI_491]|nr:hypothetical protein GQ53DRAFT_754572 [Thozetella sp. PMI_491]
MTASLGVNSFRSGLSIATRALARSVVPPSARCLSSCTAPLMRSAGSGVRSSRPSLSSKKGLWPPSPQHASLRAFHILPGHVVTTRYVDLPPNYTDEGGLPFRRTELDAQETLAIFGPELSTLAGNKLLRILHGRRVAGTLEDPEVQINTRPYTKKQHAVALEYLRRTVTVDEITNAGLRAEDELAAMEMQENEADGTGNPEKSSGPGYSTRIKLFKDAPQTQDEIYGVGAFDKVRAANKARWEEELKRREEERIRREEEEAKQNPGGLAKIDPNQTRQPSVKMQEYLAAGQSELDAPPEMSKWDRLLPCTVLVLLSTGLWVAYAQFYKPPASESRLWPDLPPAAATVGAIILANALVFCAWRVPMLWPFLNRHFILTSATPRATAILGSIFSHQAFSHLFMNMVPLWLFGTRLHDEVGRGNFLAIYFGTGAVAFLGSLYGLVLRDLLLASTLGASGAVFGTMAAYLWMHRFDYFKVFELPPEPFNGVQGLGILAFVVAMHIPHVLSKKKHNIDLVSHMVGISTGVLSGHILERKLQRQLPQQQKIHMGSAVVGKSNVTSQQ